MDRNHESACVHHRMGHPPPPGSVWYATEFATPILQACILTQPHLLEDGEHKHESSSHNTLRWAQNDYLPLMTFMEKVCIHGLVTSHYQPI